MNFVTGLAGVAMVVVGVWLVYTGVEIGWVPEMLILSMKTTPFMLLLGTLLPVFGVCLLWCLLATCYEISFQNLIVQSGPSLRRIPIDSIVAARISRGGLPRGPIWSRQMVRIDHRKGRGGRVASIVISPRDPTAFLESLAQGAPALRRQPDRSLRAEA